MEEVFYFIKKENAIYEKLIHPISKKISNKKYLHGIWLIDFKGIKY